MPQIVETQAIDNAISEDEEGYEATGILLDFKEIGSVEKVAYASSQRTLI